jgi:hypothetical protein
MSRIVFERCVSCHRPEGTAFPLTTYQDAQKHAVAIKDAVLSRRMPPWGGVKGFGAFSNDESMTQEQISLVSDWVEGGMVKGNNPNALPPLPKFNPRPAGVTIPKDALRVTGPATVTHAVTIAALYPEHVPTSASSIQIVAALPNRDVVPLVWLYEFDDRYRHQFVFRKPIELPAGSVIQGVPRDVTIVLIPLARTTK